MVELENGSFEHRLTASRAKYNKFNKHITEALPENTGLKGKTKEPIACLSAIEILKGWMG